MNDSKLVRTVLQQPDKQKAVEALERVNLIKRERETIQYIFFCGFTIEKTAELLDVSPSSVANWKKSAMKKCAVVFRK